tara:strand:+ start:931 stop:2334 length:1404 start_codon:yes stop_codon:yes gene_type:complete
MSNQYDKLITGNSVYEKTKKRNVFYYQSYQGGDTYKKGEHLSKYSNESETEYEDRVLSTPLDNHCKGVVSVYNSFLFRKDIHREWGSLENDPAIPQLEGDADLEGRSLNSFMKEANTLASVFGMMWICVSKPNSNANTRAEELDQNIRPYLSMVSPLMMLDWNYSRSASGHYVLDYVKYIEEQSEETTVIKEWYPEVVITTITDNQKREIVETITEDNGIGRVPVVAHYTERSSVRGKGVSLIADIADLQRAIYNEYSEVEQTIRLSNAASLVKTADTEAGAGPGAIIQMSDSMDPSLKPYLLQPSGASVDAIYNSIDKRIAAIDRIAHLGAIRETTAKTMSGVSRSMEFEQLGAKLSDIALALELTEENVMRIVSAYQGVAWDGVIDYPDSFNIRDENADLDFYLKASVAPINSATYKREVNTAIAKLVVGDDSEAMAQIESELDSAPTVFEVADRLVDNDDDSTA